MPSRITIYTTPQCGYCKMAKDFFKKNNLLFQEKDVVSDLGAREVMLTKSGQMSVPVIDVDGTIIVGFDQMRLKEVLQMRFPI